MKTAKISRVWVAIPALILGLVLQSSSGFCQSRSDIELIDKFGKKFLEHGTAFVAFAQGSKTEEYEVAMDFINLASTYNDKADFVSEELSIMQMLDTETDKRQVANILQKRFQREIQQIDNITIKEINLNLAHATKAVVVAEGNKLKDDLKEFQEALTALNKKVGEVKGE